MSAHYGLIIAAGSVFLSIFVVSLMIILCCPNQLGDPNRRPPAHLEDAERWPILPQHVLLPGTPSKPRPITAANPSFTAPQHDTPPEPPLINPSTRLSQSDHTEYSLEQDHRKHLNAQYPFANPPRKKVRRYHRVRAPLPRPEDDGMLDHISEEGSGAGSHKKRRASPRNSRSSGSSSSSDSRKSLDYLGKPRG